MTLARGLTSSRSRWTTPLLALALTGATVAAQAAPTFFRGVDVNANGKMPTSGPAVEAREAFLQAVVDLKTETFESFATGIPASNSLSLLGGLATLTQAAGTQGRIDNVTTPSGPGRFNTTASCSTGCKWWEAFRTFEIALGSDVSAFGFYGTDIGELGGSLTLDFWNGSNAVRTGVAVDNSGERGLTFFGYVDDQFQFNRVTFNVQQTRPQASLADRFGFDDLMVANRATVPPIPVPTPGSLALAALALGLLGASRRLRR